MNVFFSYPLHTRSSPVCFCFFVFIFLTYSEWLLLVSSSYALFTGLLIPALYLHMTSSPVCFCFFFFFSSLKMNGFFSYPFHMRSSPVCFCFFFLTYNEWLFLVSSSYALFTGLLLLLLLLLLLDLQ